MKIIAFTQLRNELNKGNLENWFKCTEPCDYISLTRTLMTVVKSTIKNLTIPWL